MGPAAVSEGERRRERCVIGVTDEGINRIKQAQRRFERAMINCETVYWLRVGYDYLRDVRIYV